MGKVYNIVGPYYVQDFLCATWLSADWYQWISIMQKKWNPLAQHYSVFKHALHWNTPQSVRLAQPLCYYLPSLKHQILYFFTHQSSPSRSSSFEVNHHQYPQCLMTDVCLFISTAVIKNIILHEQNKECLLRIKIMLMTVAAAVWQTKPCYKLILCLLLYNWLP